MNTVADGLRVEDRRKVAAWIEVYRSSSPVIPSQFHWIMFGGCISDPIIVIKLSCTYGILMGRPLVRAE